MKKWTVLMAMVLAIAWAGSSLAYETANEVGYAALEVPNPASMVCDGLDNDWGWYDPAYIIGPDEMKFIRYSSLCLFPVLFLVISAVLWWQRR